MIANLLTLFASLPIFWQRLGQILLFYLVAWLLHRLGHHLAKRLLFLDRFSRKRERLRSERLKTLQGLLSSSFSVLVFLVATLFALSLFIASDTLVWMIGLFSAAFGLGLRPLISDYLTGISFIFEDTFDVGEKIEMPGIGVQGVIEAVNLRTTVVRGTSGEQYIVPNGEVRVVRNFSRGQFSIANVTLKIPSQHLNQAIFILEKLGKEAVILLPNLLEPWHIITETGTMGQYIELTLTAKARYGHAAEMRPRLLGLVQERLTNEGVELAA